LVGMTQKGWGRSNRNCRENTITQSKSQAERAGQKIGSTGEEPEQSMEPKAAQKRGASIQKKDKGKLEAEQQIKQRGPRKKTHGAESDEHPLETKKKEGGGEGIYGGGMAGRGASGGRCKGGTEWVHGS